MIFSGILGLKKYQSRDYVSAIAISFGCVLFVVGGDTAPQQGLSLHDLFHHFLSTK
jgi:hypothetical protein